MDWIQAATAAIVEFRKQSHAVIDAEAAWTAEERKRHAMRIELSQQFRGQGKSQKDADDLAAGHPQYQEKLLDLEALRVDKEEATIESKCAYLEAQLAIAAIGTMGLGDRIELHAEAIAKHLADVPLVGK